MLALTPERPATFDFCRNAQGLAALVARLRADGPFGKPVERVVLIGFSAGALSSLLAAATPGVVGYVGRDPFDRVEGHSALGLGFAPTRRTAGTSSVSTSPPAWTRPHVRRVGAVDDMAARDRVPGPVDEMPREQHRLDVAEPRRDGMVLGLPRGRGAVAAFEPARQSVYAALEHLEPQRLVRRTGIARGRRRLEHQPALATLTRREVDAAAAARERLGERDDVVAGERDAGHCAGCCTRHLAPHGTTEMPRTERHAGAIQAPP